MRVQVIHVAMVNACCKILWLAINVCVYLVGQESNANQVWNAFQFQSVCRLIPHLLAQALSTLFNGLVLDRIDINECATNRGGCSPYALCTNLLAPYFYSCTCLDGFSGDGVFCLAEGLIFVLLSFSLLPHVLS